MNDVYKGSNSYLVLHNSLIVCGIISALFASKPDLMMFVALDAERVCIQWIILFVFFLAELICYHNKIVTGKVFVFSITVIILNYYLTYLCMFTHTPDIFTYSDFISATERFLFHALLGNYAVFLQGLSYIITISIKDKIKIMSIQINGLLSICRIVLLWVTLLPLLFSEKEDRVLTLGFVVQCFLITIIYFVISFSIEAGIDFVLRKIRTVRTE